MKKTKISLQTILLAAMIAACTGNNYREACESINSDDLATYASTLGSDSFLGRKPFTEGEQITVEYLAAELESLGFEPAFSGSYFQEVPLVEISSLVVGPVIIETGNGTLELMAPDQVAISSARVIEDVIVSDCPMVFAGFGITAPEYDWDDYSGLDVAGKIVVVMVNDPGLYTDDPSLFKGKEMTYYGRWTYKYEEAARHGALGIIILHETLGAGYTYMIPRKSSINPSLYMQTGNNNSDRCMFNGWIASEAADMLFGSQGLKVDQVRQAACNRGFRGFELDASMSLEITNSFRYNVSTNVAGILKGSEREDEAIVYSGHWDHFGIGEKENGDSIYNGAVDNGTTMAWMLEIGEAFTRLNRRPQRSIMLFFPTAEEQGLLGSMYYNEFPVFSPEKTVACINNDMMLPIGRMKDVMITGYGQSDLDDLVGEYAGKQDRYILPDPNPQTGMYFRSDHFSFARKGIPSLFARGNCDSREFGKEWAAAQEKDYLDNKYHRPSDNFDADTWDLSGVAEDAVLCFMVGYKLANSDLWPAWKEGSEFRSLRSR